MRDSFSKFKAAFLLAIVIAGLMGLEFLRRPAETPMELKASPVADHKKPAAHQIEASPATQPKAHVVTVPESASPFVRSILGATPTEQRALARARRERMRQLIRNNPREAVEQGLSLEDWLAMPVAIRDIVDRPVIGTGDFTVTIEETFPEEDHDHSDHDADEASGSMRVDRTASINGQSFEAFVYGRRRSQPTGHNLPLRGVVVEDLIALSETPVQLLNDTKAADSVPCLYSALETHPADNGVWIQIGDAKHVVCRGHLTEVENAWAAYDENGGGAGGPGGMPSIVESSWTQGQKTLLFIRVNFPDDLEEPITEAGAHDLMQGVNDWFSEVSYGTTSIAATVTPLLTMPQPVSYYQLVGDGEILTDARKLARDAGFETNDYDFDAVRFIKISGFSYAGKAYVRGKGCWLQSSSLGVACHEFGHNYGLWHANYWTGENDSIIGPGTHSEYGDIFDTMGSASAGDKHFNAFSKNKLNWLGDSFVRDASNGGTFRLHAFDRHQLNGGETYALKVRRDHDRDYWVELRHLFSGNEYIQNGVLVHVDPWDKSGSGTHLIDTTPGTPSSSSSKEDAALLVGRTFSDYGAGIHITPTRLFDSGADKSVEVVVNVGDFANNQRPTVTLDTGAAGESVNFTAIAADPDGDTLAYHWDFDALDFGPNEPVVSRAFASSGVYVVRCRVSDMKGGYASAEVVVTVGSTSQFAVTGRIVDGAGDPLEGVRVHNGKTGAAYRGGHTDSDGTYHIGRVNSGTYTLGAVRDGFDPFTVSGGWSNPANLSGDQAGMDFVALPIPSVFLTIEDGTLSEEGSDPAIVRFNRSGDTTQALDITYAQSGVGSFTSDLTLSPSPVSNSPRQFRIPAGQSYLDVTITPNDDPGGEGPEPIAITLLEDSAYRIVHRAEAQLVIEDNDTISKASINVSANYSSVDELGVEGAVDQMGFRIYRSGNKTGDITVFYELGGTATPGEDYVSPPGSIVVPAGETTAYVLFSVLEDTLVEGEETVTLTLLDDPGYNGGGSVATAYLIDNDPTTVTITVTDNELTEGGGNRAEFVFARFGNTDAALTIDFTPGGTATVNDDYALPATTITIPAGDYRAVLSLTGIADDSVEGFETVILTLKANSDYNIGNPGMAVAKIIDDEMPRITLAAIDANAGESDLETGAYRVTRSGNTSGETTVYFAVNGSARAGDDYTALPDSVTFADGESEIEIVVSPIDDSLREADETVDLQVLEAVAYHRGTVSPVTINIADNDSSGSRGISFRFASSQQSEADTNVKLPVVLSEAASASITVDFSVTGGNAGDPADYRFASGTVTIPANKLLGLVEFNLVNDSVEETAETMVLTLSNPSGAVLESQSSHTLTIQDDDASVVTITAVVAEAVEGGAEGLVRFTRTGTAAGDLPVYFDLTGTANRPSDFIFPSSPVVIPAGQTSLDISVTALNDLTVEPEEFLKLSLTGAPGSRIGSPSSTTLAIINNSETIPTSPVVTLALNTVQTIENTSSPAKFTLTRDGDLSTSLEIHLALDGPGTATEEFTDLPASFTIPALTNAVVISLQATNDGEVEGIEEWLIALQPNPAYEIETTVAETILVLDSPFNEWQMNELALNASSTPEEFDPEADPDGDGLNNFTEYAYNLDPTTGGDHVPIEKEVRGEPEFEHDSLVIRFHRRINRSDVAYALAFSEDLDAWINDPEYFEELQVTDDGNGITETVEVRLLPIPIVAERRFITLQAGRP